MWLQLQIFCFMTICNATKHLCENNGAIKSVNPVTVAKIKSFLTISTLSQTSGCDLNKVLSNYQHHDPELEFTFTKNNKTESVSNIQQVNGEGIIRYQTDKSFIRKRSHVASVKSLRSNFSQGQPTGGTNFSNQQMHQ